MTANEGVVKGHGKNTGLLEGKDYSRILGASLPPLPLAPLDLTLTLTQPQPKPLT